jgi:mevalonate kinase
MSEVCSASAPGKAILFGEHSVVYGQPAVAIPLPGIQAVAEIAPRAAGAGLSILASDISINLSLADAAGYGLAEMARLVLDRLDQNEPDALVTIHSEIPVAGGLGSGAATSAALGRALGQYLGHAFTDGELSDLVYEVEKIYHGTPSGIDNTVVCHAKAVYFVKGEPPDFINVGAPFHILIGDTGIPSPTRETVGKVRSAWLQNPTTYNEIFARIGNIAGQARQAIESGQIARLGDLMNDNQAWLQQLGVSSPQLDRLTEAAHAAGAQGAKLSGGGGGGNMIALVDLVHLAAIREALLAAGAVRVLHSIVQQPSPYPDSDAIVDCQ